MIRDAFAGTNIPVTEVYQHVGLVELYLVLHSLWTAADLPCFPVPFCEIMTTANCVLYMLGECVLVKSSV